MKHGVPFQGTSGQTAEAYLVTHLKIREKIALGILLLIGCFFCGGSSTHRIDTATHDLSACLSQCHGAQAVITANVPEHGPMCRCWASNAFSYTFSYPTTPEEADYARERWNKGMKAAEQCRRQGLGWEPDQNRDSVVCSRPGLQIEQQDLDGRPRKLSQDPLNLQRTLYTPELHWELQMVQEAPEQGHQLEPDRNWDVKEKCRQQCHIKHCESWNACNATTGTDRSACESRVNDDEKRCMNSCGNV